jgi:dTDP-4-dehydrorhamnose 3,5-epimerase
MGFHKFETSIPDILFIRPDVFGDERGFFMELFNQQAFEALGLPSVRFVQDNLSQSGKGTLRGLHFQTPPYGQGKLIMPLIGSVLDVAVDLRRSSPTFGQVMAKELHAEDKEMLYIPQGFAHGFQVISDTCLFFYKCTQYYNQSAEAGIAWDDPALDIPWRDIPPILSEKDQYHPVLADYDSPF